jgi:hypothetical protein
MMRSFRERDCTRLCSQQIEAAVNLKCVRADDFRIEITSDTSGEVGFSGRGRADDEKDAAHAQETKSGDARFKRHVSRLKLLI